MTRSQPLIVTRDESLLDALLRLAAAAGVTPEVVHDTGLLRRSWPTAPLVVLGQDVAAEVDAGTLGRRDGVCAVVTDPDDLAVWQAAVRAGAEKVLVLPEAEPWLRDRLADTADGSASRGLTVGVLGGCGGAGASTFVAVLGVVAAREGRHVLCVDADPFGGGLDLALGSEQLPGVRWPDLLTTSGRVGAASLRQALPARGSLSMLSWNRDDERRLPPALLSDVLAAGRRGSDLVLVDLPRWPDPVVQEGLMACDLVLLVVPAEVRAVAAAARQVRRTSDAARPIELVVRGPGPAGLSGRLVADSLELPLAAEMRPDRTLVADIDLGHGPWGRARGPLARACRTVLARLVDRLGAVA